MADELLNQKPVGTREWYDFVGIMADGLPYMHTGGKEATDQLIQKCGLKEGTHLLDVGCGGGNTACRIAREFGSRVMGIDISDVMVEQARVRAGKEGVANLVEFRVADVYDLPFDGASFDVVLIESVLTPLSGNKVDALKEMHRVLKPGGVMGVNETIFLEKTPADIMSVVNTHPAIYDPFTEKKLRTTLEKAGFKIREWKISEETEVPNAMKQMGCGGLIAFFVKSYPRILWKTLTDKRIREAGKIDDQVTKINKQYVRYALVIASKGR